MQTPTKSFEVIELLTYTAPRSLAFALELFADIATVPLGAAGTLRAISIETDEVIHEPIQVGLTPAWITISPEGAKVFTLNFLSDDISHPTSATSSPACSPPPAPVRCACSTS